jgi:ATP-binding cassette subfamily C (CFTR/MRP) protein 4
LEEGYRTYASQKPWLFPSTIQQNILFGQKYDEQRYQQVLKILETLQDGDGTMVEDRDTNLSREQQPRINLARTVYNQSEIYLMDDPLAGLDAQVGDFVFKECIKAPIMKTVIIRTHKQTKSNSLSDADRGAICWSVW